MLKISYLMNNSLKIIITSRIAIFVFLLIIIALFNTPAFFIENYETHEDYTSVLLFVNENIFIFFAIGILLIISGVFWALRFPFNILAPIISSAIYIFLIEILYRILLFVDDNFYSLNFNINMQDYYVMIIIVLLSLFYIKLFYEFIQINRSRFKAREIKPKREIVKKREIKEIEPIKKEVSIKKPNEFYKSIKLFISKLKRNKKEIKKIQGIEKKEFPQKSIISEKIISKKKKGLVDKLQGAIFNLLEYFVKGIISLTDFFRSSY